MKTMALLAGLGLTMLAVGAGCNSGSATETAGDTALRGGGGGGAGGGSAQNEGGGGAEPIQVRIPPGFVIDDDGEGGGPIHPRFPPGIVLRDDRGFVPGIIPIPPGALLPVERGTDPRDGTLDIDASPALKRGIRPAFCVERVILGRPMCIPVRVEACYTGPAGTAGVGRCHKGRRMCNAEGTLCGPCAGEVLPAAAVCTSTEDFDCDGLTDSEDPECTCIPSSANHCR